MAYINTREAGQWSEVEFPNPGAVPASPVVWPASQHKSNQIQQTKGSAKPQKQFVIPTTQPNASAVQSRTTPQMVSHVRVVTSKAVNGQKTIRVQFNHPGNDPYFAGARVYIRRAGQNQQPSLVAGGSSSPLTFTVPVNQAPHVLHVTSYGNWGETDVLRSPAQRVRLL